MKISNFSDTLVYLLIPIILVNYSCNGLAQDVKKLTISPKILGKLPKNIPEASGLEIDKDGNIWTHNDDGLPVLFCLDSKAGLIKVLHLNGINSGWEDLTQDDHKNFYVAGFGNNSNTKENFKIYKIPNPSDVTGDVVMPEIISYSYSDQNTSSRKNFDADALVALHESIYIFSKKPSAQGYIRIYELPTIPGNYTAKLVDSLMIGKKASMDYWITSACLSPDKRILALLFHDKILLISNFKDKLFSSGTQKIVELNDFSHKAGMTFYDETHAYIVDELEFILGGNLYSIDLSSALSD